LLIAKIFENYEFGRNVAWADCCSRISTDGHFLRHQF